MRRTASRTGGQSDSDTFSKRTSRARLRASCSRTSRVARAGGSRSTTAAHASTTSARGVTTSHTHNGGRRDDGVAGIR